MTLLVEQIVKLQLNIYHFGSLLDLTIYFLFKVFLKANKDISFKNIITLGKLLIKLISIVFQCQLF